MDHHATTMDECFHCLYVAQRVGQSHLIFLQKCCSTLIFMLNLTIQVMQFPFFFWMGMVVILKNHSWTTSKMICKGGRCALGSLWNQLWQVGDSMQQNGSLKMLLKKVKKWIVEKNQMDQCHVTHVKGMV